MIDVTPSRWCGLLLRLGAQSTSFGARGPAMKEMSAGRLGSAARRDVNGWIFLHLAGEPYERGWQHGWLLAGEILNAIASIERLLWLDYASPFSWWAANAEAMWLDRLSGHLLLDELRGIVDGVNARRRDGDDSQLTLTTLLGWNGYPELVCQWYPAVQAGQLKPLVARAAQCSAPGSSAAAATMLPAARQWFNAHHCSAFIVSGAWTRDGGLVAGHTTWQRFANGDHYNVVIALDPPSSEGYPILMQTAPGYVASSMDFGQNAAGVIAASTSIDSVGFSQKNTPYFIRARHASQHASGIEHWIDLFRDGNNGGYANTWLLGEARTGRIAAYELTAHSEATQPAVASGAYASCNIPLSPEIRAQAPGASSYDNVLKSGARRVRFQHLLSHHKGQIDANLAKSILADHHDVYTGRQQASGRTICGHFDSDDGAHNVGHSPYYPWGSLDAKVTTSDTASENAFEARWGRACGTPFEAAAFFKRHPQYEEFRQLTRDRPTQPWTVFP